MPCRTIREALRDGRDPSPVERPLAEGLTLTLRAEMGEEPLNHYVAAGFDGDGQLKDIQQGPRPDGPGVADALEWERTG